MIDFDLPVIRSYNNNTLTIKKVVKGFFDSYIMYVNGVQYMEYTNTNESVYYTVSHCLLAKGDVITTGLGFGIREKMLLENPNVTSITTLEVSDDVIEYHKAHNKELMDKITVINCDANSFSGKCDTLLLDHYEHLGTTDADGLFKVIDHCVSNIDHKLLWFWPLELHATTIHEYEDLRRRYSTLPELTSLEFQVLRHIYHSKDDVFKQQN